MIETLIKLRNYKVGIYIRLSKEDIDKYRDVSLSVENQIMALENYVKENNYTYSGMLKTLKWYYEKEGNSLDKSNGSIGIIPIKVETRNTAAIIPRDIWTPNARNTTYTLVSSKNHTTNEITVAITNNL